MSTNCNLEFTKFENNFWQNKWEPICSVKVRNSLEQRMYSIVLRSLSGIAKGIQNTHSVVEYANKYSKGNNYRQWAQKDKTLILLETYTTASFWDIREVLEKHEMPFAEFHEPDLGGIPTSISFLLDERVWNVKKYPVDDNGFIIGVDKKYTILRDWIFGFKLASS